MTFIHIKMMDCFKQTQGWVSRRNVHILSECPSYYSICVNITVETLGICRCVRFDYYWVFRYRCSTDIITATSMTVIQLSVNQLCVCQGKPPVTGGFPAQRDSNPANASTCWRQSVEPNPHNHHACRFLNLSQSRKLLILQGQQLFTAYWLNGTIKLRSMVLKYLQYHTNHSPDHEKEIWSVFHGIPVRPFIQN